MAVLARKFGQVVLVGVRILSTYLLGADTGRVEQGAGSRSTADVAPKGALFEELNVKMLAIFCNLELLMSHHASVSRRITRVFHECSRDRISSIRLSTPAV